MRSFFMKLQVFLLLIAPSFLFAQDEQVHILPPKEAQATQATAAPANSTFMLNFILLGVLVLMIFFMYRSQAKRQKEHKNFLDNLKTGDEVVTNSGIIGTIAELADSYVILNTGTTRIKVLKSFILQYANKPIDPKTLETTTLNK